MPYEKYFLCAFEKILFLFIEGIISIDSITE